MASKTERMSPSSNGNISGDNDSNSGMGSNAGGETESTPGGSASQKRPFNNGVKVRRKMMSLQEKIAILDQLNHKPPSISLSQFARNMGLAGVKVVSSLLKEEEKLREAAKNGTNLNKMRQRPGKAPEIERELAEWYFAELARGEVLLNGPAIRAKAEEIGAQMGKSFQANEGWFGRWKVRYGITAKKSKEPQVITRDDWYSITLPSLMKKCQLDDIYCLGEIGLFFRAVTNGSMEFHAENLYCSPHSSERVIVLCCCNMTGRDKVKLLVVGVPQSTGLKTDGDVSPVAFKPEADAVMTKEIFSEWIFDWDRQLRCEGRRIVLLLDKCEAHILPGMLHSIRLQYLPPNTASTLLPINVGIAKTLKTLYRVEVINGIFSKLERGILTPMSTPAGVSSTVSLQDALQYLGKAWAAVKESVIRKGFFSCGLCSDHAAMDVFSGNEEARLPKYVVNGDLYDAIDDNVACYAVDEDLLHQTIASEQESRNNGANADFTFETFGERFEVEVNNDGDHNNESNSEQMRTLPSPAHDAASCESAETSITCDSKVVSHEKAKECVDMLYRYAAQHGLGDAIMSSLDLICAKVHRKAAADGIV